MTERGSCFGNRGRNRSSASTAKAPTPRGSRRGGQRRSLNCAAHDGAPALAGAVEDRLKAVLHVESTPNRILPICDCAELRSIRCSKAHIDGFSRTTKMRTEPISLLSAREVAAFFALMLAPSF